MPRWLAADVDAIFSAQPGRAEAAEIEAEGRGRNKVTEGDEASSGLCLRSRRGIVNLVQ